MVTSYKEMTLQMYEHLSKIAESDTDDIEKQIQMVSVLTGKSVKEVEDLPISVYHDLAKKDGILDARTRNRTNKEQHRQNKRTCVCYHE